MQSECITHRTAGLVNTAGIAVILTLYMAIVFGLGLYLFPVLVSFMQKSLNFENPAVGIITGGAQLSYLAAALFCSRAVRRFGGGYITFVAALTAGFLLTLLSAVQNIWQAGALLIALGSCAAMVVIPTVSVIGRAVPLVWQSGVNGLISSGTAYGQLATGLLVPFLIHNYDWRTVWVITGAFSVAVAVIGCILLRRLASDAFESEIPKDCSEKQERPYVTNRYTPIAIPRNFIIWVLLALSGLACGPWQNYLASFLGNERGFSISFTGQLWSIIGVTGLASGFAFGLLVAFEGGIMALRAAAVAFGLSFYAIYGLIPAYITKTSRPETSTPIFAVANVFLGVSTSFGNAGSGFFQAWVGSFQGIYIGVAVIAAMGIVLSLTLPDERKMTRNA